MVPQLVSLDKLHISCPRCGHHGPHSTGPGSGPHHARLVCGRCSRFLAWLPQPRPAAQEDVHE